MATEKSSSLTTAVERMLVGKPTAQQKPAQRTLLEFLGIQSARWLGSIQVAVLLLPLFALVLFVGTLLESWYDRNVACQLVYHTWWFVTLLAMLGVNIFFAAVKKWPWKRHQTGFLITHVGLLMLVSGGIFNGLAGTNGTLFLVDSDDARASSYGARTSKAMIDRQTQTIRVQRPGLGAGDALMFDFAPGPLPWRADQYVQPSIDPLTTFLSWLAHPLPRQWSADLGDGGRLEVLGFYPHSREQPFRPVFVRDVRPDDAHFPAVKVQLGSATTGLLPEQWVAGDSEHRTARVGPGLIEFLGQGCRTEQLAEFGSPPLAGKAGAKGQLVLGVGGQTHRIDVATHLDQPAQSLGDSGWSLRVIHYVSNYRQASDSRPADPAISFELTSKDGRTLGLVTTARRAGELFPLPEYRHDPQAIKDLWVWFHPPDPRYGDAELKAILQFATAAEGTLHYRSFSSSNETGFGFEKTDIVRKLGERQRLWAGMSWRFQVSEYLLRALPGPHFVPFERGAGAGERDTTAALRCRLTKGTEAVEFWVGATDFGATPVTVGSETYRVGYNSTFRDLGFSLTLLRAEQTTDAGTAQPATQSSYVLLTDPSRNIQGEPRVITLNQPLTHGGYRCYQAGWTPLGQGDNGKPMSRSLLTVDRDPGLDLKYGGSTMLALGIGCMFYMRAYFFKRHGGQ